MERKVTPSFPIDFPYLSDARKGYMDFFSSNADNKEPVILADGTSVQFPYGWTDEDADKWRKGMDLQPPTNFTARTYFN